MFTVFDRVMVKQEDTQVKGIIIGIAADNRGAAAEVLLEDGSTNYYRDGDWMQKLPTIAVLDVVLFKDKTWTVKEIFYSGTHNEVGAKLEKFPGGRGTTFANVLDCKGIPAGGMVTGPTINIINTHAADNSIINKNAERIVEEMLDMCPGGPKYRVLDRVSLRMTGTKGTITAYDRQEKVYTIYLDKGGRVKRRQGMIEGKLKSQFDIGDTVVTPHGRGVLKVVAKVNEPKRFLYYGVLLDGDCKTSYYHATELTVAPKDELRVSLNGSDIACVDVATLEDMCRVYENVMGNNKRISQVRPDVKRSVGKNRQLLSFIKKNRKAS